MISKPSVEELLKNARNRYELAMAVSKRARQLVDGDEKLIKTDENSEITIAAMEFEKEKFKIKHKENEEEDKF